MNVQKTLLRFLQEQEFLRIGDTTPTKVDVRVLSATNSDLKGAVKSGEFREDLYYRLNVVNIHLPPLRERQADIPLLAAHFIREQNDKFGTRVKGFSPDALAVACAYGWPGNIRQLKNVIEASMAMESEESISLEVLSQFVELPEGEPLGPLSEISGDGDYSAVMSRFESEYLRGLLGRHGWNVESAARDAGINMATMYRKIKKYGLKKE